MNILNETETFCTKEMYNLYQQTKLEQWNVQLILKACFSDFNYNMYKSCEGGLLFDLFGLYEHFDTL